MRLSTAGTSAGKLQRLVHIQESIAVTDRRLLEIESKLRALENCELSAADVGAALREFDALWAHLTPGEQERVIQVLVQRVEFDGVAEPVTVTYHPTGMRSLMQNYNKVEGAVA